MKKLLSLFVLLSLLKFLNAAEPEIPTLIKSNKTHNSSMYALLGNNKAGNAHIFSIEYGKIISAFNYKNSKGERLENLENKTNNHLRLGWRMHFKTSKLYLLSGISYNKYGAKGSDPALGNYYDWDVNYVGVNFGVGYEFFKIKSYYNFPYVKINPGLTFFVHASIASDFLVQGTQTINSDVYDLVGVEEFDKPFIFAYGTIGSAYYVSKIISVKGMYTYGQSFSVFNSDISKQETLNFTTHTFSLGISISLPLM